MVRSRFYCPLTLGTRPSRDLVCRTDINQEIGWNGQRRFSLCIGLGIYHSVFAKVLNTNVQCS